MDLRRVTTSNHYTCFPGIHFEPHPCVLGEISWPSFSVYWLPCRRQCLPAKVGIFFADPILAARSEDVHIHCVFHGDGGVRYIRRNQ